MIEACGFGEASAISKDSHRTQGRTALSPSIKVQVHPCRLFRGAYHTFSIHQWITSVIIPLPRKGDLSLMTNYRGISLMSLAVKGYNKILVKPSKTAQRSPPDEKHPGRNCAQQIHFWRRIMEGWKVSRNNHIN